MDLASQLDNEACFGKNYVEDDRILHILVDAPGTIIVSASRRSL